MRSTIKNQLNNLGINPEVKNQPALRTCATIYFHLNYWPMDGWSSEMGIMLPILSLCKIRHLKKASAFRDNMNALLEQSNALHWL